MPKLFVDARVKPGHDSEIVARSVKEERMTTILVTGFGPFPGAPFNPTAPLIARLVRLRRPRLADVKIVPHVFPTSYAAVGRELAQLIAAHQPDALLMFGLATRANKLRVETRARNTTSIIPDVGGATLRRHAVEEGAPAALALPAPAPRLLSALRGARVPAKLSHDAGGYLCNYLCWKAAEAARRPHGPRLAGFIHVPKVRRHPRPRTEKCRLALDDLVRAAERLLVDVAAAARR
jgi:pyroglutamyl-peptidase